MLPLPRSRALIRRALPLVLLCALGSAASGQEILKDVDDPEEEEHPVSRFHIPYALAAGHRKAFNEFAGSHGDGKITVTDGVLIIQHAAGNLDAVFDCAAANDANGDNTSDIADGVFLLNYVFKRDSPVPPPPFRMCETQAGADCNVSNCAG